MNRSKTLTIGGAIGLAIAVTIIAGFFLLDSGEPVTAPAAEQRVSRNPKADVEKAYLEFWKVWAKANLELTSAPIQEVAGGEALKALTEQLKEQKAKNQPVLIRVDHNYRVFLRDSNTASVDDSYVNHSMRLDPNTREPIEQDPNATVRKSHTLKKSDGRWRVVEIIEYR